MGGTVMENMMIYNAVRECPKEALKTIPCGRLSGKSDINPMWRIKKLTEVFGICGFGWKYTIDRQWTETFGNEVKAFVNISMYVKMNGEWSEAIPGNGGSTFVEQSRNGAYVNDECFKMALTDAISVACKALGIAADVYWSSDNTKYNDGKRAVQMAAAEPQGTMASRPVANATGTVAGAVVAQPSMAERTVAQTVSSEAKVEALLVELEEKKTKAEVVAFMRDLNGTAEFAVVRPRALAKHQSLKA